MRMEAMVAAAEDSPRDSPVIMEGQLYLKGTGMVAAALFQDALTWHRVSDGHPHESPCSSGICGLPPSRASASAGVSPCLAKDMYAVETLKEPEEITLPQNKKQPTVKMHGFTVHTFQREPTKWVPTELIFYHEDARECRSWATQLQSILRADPERPRRLMVFVNPYGGHRLGLTRWEDCKVILDRAGIDLDVVVTTHRNHAYETMENATDEQLMLLDGIIVVGGDGFFNEVLNGLAKHRHLAPACIRPKSRVGPAPKENDFRSRRDAQCPTVPAAATTSETPMLRDFTMGSVDVALGTRGGLREGVIPVAATRSDPTMLRDYVSDSREGMNAGHAHAAHGAHEACQGHARAVVTGKGSKTSEDKGTIPVTTTNSETPMLRDFGEDSSAAAPEKPTRSAQEARPFTAPAKRSTGLQAQKNVAPAVTAAARNQGIESTAAQLIDLSSPEDMSAGAAKATPSGGAQGQPPGVPTGPQANWEKVLLGSPNGQDAQKLPGQGDGGKSGAGSGPGEGGAVEGPKVTAQDEWEQLLVGSTPAGEGTSTGADTGALAGAGGNTEGDAETAAAVSITPEELPTAAGSSGVGVEAESAGAAPLVAPSTSDGPAVSDMDTTPAKPTASSTSAAASVNPSASGGLGGAPAAPSKSGICPEDPNAGNPLDSLNVGLNLRKKIRIGIIPAGSTDCIVMSATGSRDHVTAAIHIALGERLPLDVVRITSWGHGPHNLPAGANPTPAQNPKEEKKSRKREKKERKREEKERRKAEKARRKGKDRDALPGPGAPGTPAVIDAPPAEPDTVVPQALAGVGAALPEAAQREDGAQKEKGQASVEGLSGPVPTPVAGSGAPSGLAAEPLANGNGAEEGDDIQVQYAASFVAYGFYGDVARHSEQLRWMGPMRYDYAGFMTYMRHRAYDAEVSYLHMPPEVEEDDTVPLAPVFSGSNRSDLNYKRKRGRRRRRVPEPEKGALPRAICTMGCMVCANGQDFSRLARESTVEDESASGTPAASRPGSPPPAKPRAVPTWRTIRGMCHSVGAAVMSCRNEKAPSGVAAHAHLADGHLHLILIRKCSRRQYLLQLLRMTWKGADPLDFKFVEHHKTPAFTFIAHGRRSLWNIDGELLDAKEVSGQVFRGLVDLFACGPEC